MDSQKEQFRCLCGFSSDLCNEKHRNLDCRLVGIKDELSKSEERIKEHIDTSEAHTIERLTHQKEIVNAITNSLNESFKESLDNLTDGLNAHRKLIEEQDKRIEELEKKLPTNAIKRVVRLEDWQKRVTYGGIAIIVLIEVIVKWGGKVIELIRDSGVMP